MGVCELLLRKNVFESSDNCDDCGKEQLVADVILCKECYDKRVEVVKKIFSDDLGCYNVGWSDEMKDDFVKKLLENIEKGVCTGRRFPTDSLRTVE